MSPLNSASNSDDAPSDEGAADPIDAARDAVAQARLVARERGYRPGRIGARRTKAADIGSGRTGSRGSGHKNEDGRDPGLLADQFDRLLLERGWQVDAAGGAVIARWSQIVGAEVAAHCEVATFDDGVLTVTAESTAWRTQLEYLESTLLGKIEEAVGDGVVSSIRFVGPRTPSWKHGRFLAPGSRGPRDTYG